MGRVLEFLTLGFNCDLIGMWSKVVELCVRGSQRDLVCGQRSIKVEVKMLV